jgi:hypothetical protein
MRVMTQATLQDALGADGPIGLVAIPAEHAQRARERRKKNPATVSELLRYELGPTWARESVVKRRAAVKQWLEDHTSGALLKLDIRAQQRSGGILAD